MNTNNKEGKKARIQALILIITGFVLIFCILTATILYTVYDRSLIDFIQDFGKEEIKEPEPTPEYKNPAIMEYKKATEEIEKISSTEFKEINIVGGGCQNVLLNELTAYHTGKKVVAGPVEATATGNILAQMIANGCVSNVAEGKKLIKDSFEIKEIMA